MEKKTALITGGSRGIGRAISIQLAKDGFNIWLNYRSNDTAALDVKKNIEEMGVSCRILKFDVSDFDAVKKVLGPLLEEEFLDVLVNNAGITKDQPLVFMTTNEWSDVVNTNLGGFFNVTRNVIVSMAKKKKKINKIINIVSVTGESGNPGQVNYSATKGGIIAATKSLALEVAKRNILVNAVSPGFIDTDMTKDLPEDEIISRIPLKRVGKSEDVAAMVSFLASDKSNYITGQVFRVNGGMYM